MRFQTMVGPAHVVDQVTSAASAAIVTVTLGWKPSYVTWTKDTGGVNDVYEKWQNDATGMNSLTTGTTGVRSLVADASGITLTDRGFTVAIAAQVNDGVNEFIAYR